LITYPGWQASLLALYGAGVLAGGGPAEVARELRALQSDPARRQVMGRAARRLAEDRLARDRLVQDFEQVLLRVTGERAG
jgi:hypothetical protein